MCSQKLIHCSLCGKSNSRQCSNCKKVSYCSQNCQKSDWSVHRTACLPVNIDTVGTAGRGLVAARKIKAGDLIVRDVSVIALPATSGVWEAGAEIYRQVQKLSKTHREEFYRLTRKKGLLEVSENLLKAAGDDEKRLETARKVAERIQETAIFFNNDIATEDGHKCLFLKLSLTNHSCCPNSSWTGSCKNPRQLELRAAKDIEEGEEVTVNYIVVEARFLDRVSRQARLLDGWGFNCVCPLCDIEPRYREFQEREERLKGEIRRIQSEMTQECDQSPTQVSWKSLARSQKDVVTLVTHLESGKLLLVRELNSLVHLAQLARDQHLIEEGMTEWRNMLTSLKVERAWADFNQCQEKLKQYSGCVQKSQDPVEAEIRQFLWLM